MFLKRIFVGISLAVALAAGCARSFDERCERIKVGMTPQQVRSLMGEPTRSDPTGTLWVYEQDGRRAGLRFASNGPEKPPALTEIHRPGDEDDE